MLEYEQQSITGICPICSRVEGRYRHQVQERKFITNAQDDRKIICSKCGYSTSTSNLKHGDELNSGGQI